MRKLTQEEKLAMVAKIKAEQAEAKKAKKDGWLCACGSSRVVRAQAKVSDGLILDMYKSPGDYWYVPGDMGLGNDGDYLDFCFCLGCGKIQGEWPRPTTRREKGLCQNVEHHFKSERMYCECAGELDDS